jgi:hypothetical protein
MITQRKLLYPPKCLSLGEHGRFFASIGTKIGTTKIWKLPKTTEEYLGNLQDYDAVWLGKGEAYVAVRKGGGTSLNLQGKYPGLGDAIKENGAPKVSPP